MKAIYCTKYGQPNVLQLITADKPKPGKNEILVKNMASSVNSGDIRIRRMAEKGFLKFFMRIVLGFTKPRQAILGNVFSGQIETTGKNVTRFSTGDEVFGMTGFKLGAYAEYILVNEKRMIVKKPRNASFEEAAAILFGGQAAAYFIGKLLKEWNTNAKILIVGGSGSVGSSAIQIAKFYKAKITTVCRSDKTEFMKSMGIQDIICYDKEDVSKCNKKFDIIFDAAGVMKKKQCLSLLEKGGIFKSVGGLEYATEKTEQLELLKKLFETENYDAVIDKTFPFDEAVEAHSYFESGKKKGNVVLKIHE